MKYTIAFSTVMFAFSGASTFPTIQSDMKDRSRFPVVAAAAMTILSAVYTAMAAVGYFQLGSAADANIVKSICDGPVRDKLQMLPILLRYC